MSEQWSRISISYDEDKQSSEILIGWLNFYGVDSVVEQESFLDVYVASEKVKEVIDNIKRNESLRLEDIQYEQVENENWNAVWESNFDSIIIGDVGIRAEFHDPLDVPHEILIKPQMAFGTGHHETTHMMIDKMTTLDFNSKSVFDYGCGTGILAVLAAKLGASNILAIDIQKEAIENTNEHILLNDLNPGIFSLFQSDIEFVSDQKFDVILANINRHILLSKVKDIKAHLASDGVLLMSGILQSDEKLVLSTYGGEGFVLKSSVQKGEWCLFEFGL